MIVFWLVTALAAQFVIAVGFASFGITSREHVEKAFPESLRWGGAARLMHRGRLHLMLALLGLEAIVLPALAGVVFRLFEGAGAETPLWRYGPVPLVAAALAVVASSVAGFGAASARPVRCAVAASFPLLPVYLVARPFTELFLRGVSLVFPNLPREMASPFFLFPSRPGSDHDGFIAEKGSRLIHRIREFGVKKVRDVMVPRIDVFALDIHAPVEDIVERVAAAGHSRVPLYDGSIDRIVGVLYVKDLLKVPRGAEPRLDRGSLVRQAYFVPEGKKLDDLLGEFQRERRHLAVVVDEYGGTAGIVTLEDILEEIVGEIRDEYDFEAPLVRRLSKNQYAVAGRTPIDELNAALGLSLPSDEVDTLGGFLYNLVGRVPVEGEEIEYGGVRFTIARLEGRRIVEVIAWVPGSGASDSHGG